MSDDLSPMFLYILYRDKRLSIPSPNNPIHSKTISFYTGILDPKTRRNFLQLRLQLRRNERTKNFILGKRDENSPSSKENHLEEFMKD